MSKGECERCDGSGKEFFQYGEPPAEPWEDGKLVWDSKPCPDCDGEGIVYGEPDIRPGTE